RVSTSAPAACSWGLDSNSLSRTQAAIEFSRKIFDGAVSMNQLRFAGSAVFSAIKPIRSAGPAIRKQGQFGVGKGFDLSDDAVAAAVFAGSPAAPAKRILANPKRVGVLKRFRRSVERIRHVSVDAGDAGLRGTGTHATGNGFVIRKGLIRAGIDATDR